MRHVRVGEISAIRLRAYFDVWLLDGKSPATGESGGQPEYSLNGGSFNSVGIGVLVAVQYGRYYAALLATILTTPGDVIKTRYKSAITLESAGDSFLVVSADSELPDDDVSIAHYGTVQGGDAYFAGSLGGRRWKRSSPQNRLAGLVDATRIIDRLDFAGSKAGELQVLQFPRANSYTDPISLATTSTADANVPDAVNQAAYLVAEKLLDGWDPDIEADMAAVAVSRFQGASTVYQREYVPEYVRAGIPSASAWSLLRPYVRDTHEVEMARM